MKTKKLKRYESPKAEVIEMESQGVLCASGDGQATTGITGSGGTQFGTNGGSW